MIKNVLIAVLTVSTVAFGYKAFFAGDTNQIKTMPESEDPEEEITYTELSEEILNKLEPEYPDNVINQSSKEIIKEYRDKGYFNRIYDYGTDSSINFKQMVFHLHERVLARIKNEGNPPPEKLTDGKVSSSVTFKITELKSFLDDADGETVQFHFAAYTPFQAKKYVEQYNKGLPLNERINIQQVNHKPTIIGIAKSKSKSSGYSAISGQICPPPRGCLK